MSEGTEIATQQNFITTEVQKETINFQWDSARLQEILDNPSGIHFQRIYLESRDKSKWHLFLSVSTYRGITIYVNCKLESATTNLEQFALWDVFAINADGKTETKFKMEDNYKRGNVFNHLEEKRIASYENVPTVDGLLKMKGRLTIFKGTKNVDSSQIFPLTSFEKSSVSELQRDISDLLLTPSEDKKFADVELFMDDGTVIRAHRVLRNSSRSDYFKVMLSSGMMEQTTGKISIEEINGKAMKALLHFLYSGRLSEDWSDSEVLHDFTKAAHRYQIMTLVEFLDANIAKVCDSRYAGDLLLLCKTLGMKTAEDGLRRLIKNNLKEINGEPEFDDLLLLIAKRQNVLEK